MKDFQPSPSAKTKERKEDKTYSRILNGNINCELVINEDINCTSVKDDNENKISGNDCNGYAEDCSKNDGTKVTKNKPFRDEFKVNKKLLPIKLATFCFHGGKCVSFL